MRGRTDPLKVEAKFELDLPSSSSGNRWQQRLKRVEDVDWSVWDEDGIGNDRDSGVNAERQSVL